MNKVSFDDRMEYHNDKGQPHRLDGPAVIYHNGDVHWMKDGRFHREDNKPAIILINGGQHWFVNGERHRTDGPAVMYTDGQLVWFIDGIECNKEEFNKLRQRRETIKKLLGGKD